MKLPLDWRWLLALLLVLLAGLYFYLMRPDAVGLLYDDGMYLMAAKALAHGHGYRLMEIDGQPFFYKYPPLYSLCLAGLWLLNPHFPANLPWLKSFNISICLATLGLLAYHYRRNLRLSPWVSLALVVCLGFSWRLIDLSIELMSEPLFLLLSVATLVLAHRYDEHKTPLSWRRLLCLLLLSVAAFYARSMGLVLVVALGIWMWSKGQRKNTLIYLAGCSTLLAPWFLWSASKPDTTYPIGNFLIRTFQETYFQSFKMDLRYEFTLPELYSKGVQELLGNFSVQFFPPLEWFFRSKPTLISEGLIMGLSFALVLFLGRYAYQSVKAGKLSPSGLYIGLYLLILPGWSFFKFYPRFILMLLPFLLAALVQAIQAQSWSNKLKQGAIGSLLTILFASNLAHLWPYLSKPVPNTLLISPYHDIWSDYKLAASYIKAQTPTNAILYTDNNDESYFYGLNTGRTTLDFFILYPKVLLDKECGEKDLDCLQAHLQQKSEILYQVLQQKHTGYVIYNRFAILKNHYNNWTLGLKPASQIPLILRDHPQSLQPIMQTPDGWITIYSFQPTEEDATHQNTNQNST